MKSLLITFDYPPMVGGIAHLLSTLWRLAGNDHSAVLAPSGHASALSDRDHPIRTIRFPSPPGRGVFASLLGTASGLAWSVYLLLRLRPEVVIAGQVGRAGPIAHAWSKLTGRPFYVWVYGGETSPRFTSLRWSTRYLHRVLRDAALVFTIGPYTSASMVDFGIPADRIVEILPGVSESLDRSSKDPEYVSRLGLEDKLVFLTVGRLVERKGVDTMLRALGDLGNRLPDWHYLVVSDGPFRTQLEALTTELELENKVTFTGLVENHELPIYYNLCDVFAMPNRETAGKHAASLSVEGFGMVLVDAAAYGKPVIAGRSGGVVDAVDDGVNGILVNPGDINGVQAAILRLSDDDVRSRISLWMAENGARWSGVEIVAALAVASMYGLDKGLFRNHLERCPIDRKRQFEETLAQSKGNLIDPYHDLR